VLPSCQLESLKWGVVPLVYIERDAVDREVVIAIRIRDDKYNDPQVIGQSVDYAMKVLGNAYTFIFRREKHATLLLVSPEDFEALYEFAADAEIRHDFFKSYDADQDARSLFSAILRSAIRQGVSDIHINPTSDGRFRVAARRDDILYDFGDPLPYHRGRALVGVTMALADIDASRANLVPGDGQIVLSKLDEDIAADIFAGYNLRVATIPCVGGQKATLRVLNNKPAILDLTHLGFYDEDIAALSAEISRPNGIMLVTGPTGSGKTTSLYSLLGVLNDGSRSILTLEDPVEYRLEGIAQVQVNPQAGLTFSAGLRSFLRHDPNVVLVGEIRDAETAEIAVHTAMTGHMVFSTLHTNDAPGVLPRLFGLDIDRAALATSLRAVVSQRLARKLCLQCAETYDASQHLSELVYGRRPGSFAPGIEMQRAVSGKHCDRCYGTGYAGRTVVPEIMIIDDNMRYLISKGEVSEQAIVEAAMAAGMKPMPLPGLILAMDAKTDLAELGRIIDRGQFERYQNAICAFVDVQ
jgi:type II secretory ATPase GspE/PulE/Tfp pilus assembly ATPase PilB-like protein